MLHCKWRMHHTLHKGTHKWDNMNPCISRTPYLEVSPKNPPHTPYMIYIGSSWETSHDLGIGLPNRAPWHLSHIPKLGKTYKVFEHLFSLKRGVWCTCLGGSCIRYGLLGMILVTCGPLEGTFVCLYTTFPGEQVSMGRWLRPNLHEGFGAQGWTPNPTSRLSHLVRVRIRIRRLWNSTKIRPWKFR